MVNKETVAEEINNDEEGKIVKEIEGTNKVVKGAASKIEAKIIQEQE